MGDGVSWTVLLAPRGNAAKLDHPLQVVFHGPSDRSGSSVGQMLVESWFVLLGRLSAIGHKLHGILRVTGSFR